MKDFNLIQEKLHTWWNHIIELVPNLVVCIIFLVIFAFISKYLIAIISRILHRVFPENANKNTPRLLTKIATYIIYTLGIFIALEILNLGSFITKFLGSLGIAGVIAGVALKDIVTGMFAGFAINFEKTFQIGDIVTISNTKGEVMDINMLTTKLKTETGEIVFVPNQLIFNSPFTNHSKKD
jgi:small conductance mechanosensitive channel